MRKRANAPLPGGRWLLPSTSCARRLSESVVSVCLSSTVPGRDRTTPSSAFHTFPYPPTQTPTHALCLRARLFACPSSLSPLVLSTSLTYSTHTRTHSSSPKSHPGSGAERPLTRKTTRELGLSTLDLRSLQIPSLRQTRPPHLFPPLHSLPLPLSLSLLPAHTQTHTRSLCPSLPHLPSAYSAPAAF
ncbi:hypothetical protein COCCADRAFT_108930 [Bipolaris zeicola 26-R-13]|uniref:Uncharacterized protein n=1 Tax=Cochliobolus carbonum (strain 26-R-13) TaxID=930089 RepID=W6YBI1_COCC2|nr:uncharacterized protein COCCADRAFT_108930 [Bipolaris zeicola 26-R-13]EUC28516.1 hypothetical protein COCCADRAFT_108930 [Bipolaris zeicola 26-R-13]